MYKDADDNYRKSLIKKKATETAIADLKKVSPNLLLLTPPVS